MREEYTGVDLPNLIGCTVRIYQGILVVGVIESVRNDRGRSEVTFSAINKQLSRWRGAKSDVYYVFPQTVVDVLDYKEQDQDSELVLFFADILCEHRVIGSTSVNTQDLRQAREVIKAMERLVNNE